MSVARYYSWLSWFQDAARLVAHDTGQGTQTVHRRLRNAEGDVSGDVLHGLLLQALHATSTASASAPAPAALPALNVLDAGCGLGGTIFALQARLGGKFCGITLSPTQAARATAEAAKRGVSDACRFVVRDYDSDLRDLVPAGVDLILAIESLAHAPDPSATLARLGSLLRPGGRLLIVDDVPRDPLPLDDPDYAGFRQGWLCPAVANDATLAAALERAGLHVSHDEDLTPLMPQRGRVALAALVWLGRGARAALRRTPAGVLIGALYGGVMLERLYRRELVRYRLIVAHAPLATRGGASVAYHPAVPGSPLNGPTTSSVIQPP